jgi:hypothetical protein
MTVREPAGRQTMSQALRHRVATAFAITAFACGVFASGADAQAPASTAAPAAAAAAAPAPATVPATTTTTQTVTAPATAAAVQPAPQRPTNPPPTWFVLGVIVGLALVGMVFLFALNAALGPAKWSLADALSEEVSLPVQQPNNAGPVMNAGQVVLAPQLVASSSRLIALMGMFGILMLYLGFGGFVLYFFGTGQPIPPETTTVRNFLFAGMSLFAPYLVNRFANVFESFAPKSNP